MQAFLTLLRHFRRNQHGGIYILFAAGLLLLMAGMALTVDLGGTYVRQSNLQQGLRNATQEPAKELVYMWLRCRTQAGPRPKNILPNCVSDDAALAQLQAYMQNYVQSNVPDSVRVTVNSPTIQRTSTGVFLYTTATFQMTRFFRFWDQTPKPITVESNRLLVDLTPNSELQPAIYATADASNQSERNQMNDAINRAVTALNDLGYVVDPICGAHLYGQGSQMPNGGGCSAKDASGIWTGQCATGDAAMEHRIGPLYAQFQSQHTRRCPTRATWTVEKAGGTRWCKQKISVPSCTNGDICGWDNHSDEHLCAGACSCSSGFSATTCGGQPCCKREWTTARSCCHACENWNVARCTLCNGSNWHTSAENVCWNRSNYTKAVWYASCKQEDVLNPGLSTFDPAGFGGTYRDPKDLVEFVARYVGNNPLNAPIAGVQELVGEIVPSVPGLNLPVQNELLAIRGANSRRAWVWECGLERIGQPGTGNWQIRSYAYGGQQFYSPSPSREAVCIPISTIPSETYTVAFKPADCNMSNYVGCEIKEGYWKIYARIKGGASLTPPMTPTNQTGPLMYNALIYDKNGPNTQFVPSPEAARNCDKNESWCSDRDTNACNDNFRNEFNATMGAYFKLDARYEDNLIASPGYVPGEHLYISSFAVETARPNDNIVGQLLDAFSSTMGNTRRIFTSKDIGKLDGLRFSNEVSIQDGVLALTSADTGKEIPVGVTQVGEHRGTRVQSIHTVYAPDGLTPATNVTMGAGLGQCQAVITQPTSRTPAIDPSASCDAVERGAQILLNAVSGTNRIPVLIAGITCPQNTCATSYRGAQAPFGHHENKNYAFNLGNKRMPNMGCNGGFNYQSQTGACMVAAVSALRNRGIVFPYHLGGANTCQPELLQMSTDANNENAVGDHICIPGQGCTSGDAAADIAFAIVMATRQVGRETAQGEADMFR